MARARRLDIELQWPIRELKNRVWISLGDAGWDDMITFSAVVIVVKQA